MTTTPTKNESLPEPMTASMCPSPDYAKGWNDCLAALTREAPTEGVGHDCANPDNPCWHPSHTQPPHQDRGEVACDYVPGKLDETAPARVWLQIDTMGDNDDRDEEWPGSEHVTWQDESMGGLEIQYIRADLSATLTEAKQQEGEAFDVRGGSLYLDRDQWGVVIDALIQHKGHAEVRKGANPASNSDARAEMCDLLIGMIGDAASKPPQVEAKRQTGEGAVPDDVRDAILWAIETKAHDMDETASCHRECAACKAEQGRWAHVWNTGRDLLAEVSIKYEFAVAAKPSGE